MANFTINGTETFNNNSANNSLSLLTTYTTSGSNGNQANTFATGSAWTLIDTGSCNNLRYAIFNNEDLLSAICIATSSTGGYPIATLQPQDSFVLPWAKSTMSITPALWCQSTSSLGGTNNTGSCLLQSQLIPI